LKEKGIKFHTTSDSEVLLNALMVWGEDAIPKLNGMFAFCFWDNRKKQLIVARDRFGEKPLFLGIGKFGTLVFASEMKAILAHPLIQVSADDEALALYGRGDWYEDRDITFFKNVERMPSSYVQVYNENGLLLKKYRYWTPDYTQVKCDISPKEARSEFRELLINSVKLRMRSDVNVGSSLSGGLDSSFIVGIMSGLLSDEDKSPHTFSACFPDDPTLSEEPDIDAMLSLSGAIGRKINPDPIELMEESAKLHWHQEEPFLSASIYLQWCVARLAKDNSTTVLLDGQGADELLAGYQFYYKQYQLDLLDNKKIDFAIRDADTFNTRMLAASHGYENASRRFNPLTAYNAGEISELAQAMPSVFHYDYSVGVAPAKEGFRLRRTISEALLYNSLPMLLRYADRNSMAFSREVRLPYLDHNLVDFCLSLPDELYIRNGWQKWILRSAASGLMPEKIRWRIDKVGYAAPLDIWLRNQMKEWAECRLFDSRLENVPGYDVETIDSLWKNHQSEAENNSWSLWRWISLSEWFELKDSSIWDSPKNLI
jgi:asparagine synthase (glutamine-hydrolysing)